MQDSFIPSPTDWLGPDFLDEDEEGGGAAAEHAATRIQAACRAKEARQRTSEMRLEGRMLLSQVLTLELIKPRFHDLAPTPDGLSFAPSRLEASGLRLAGSLAPLATLGHLRTLDLSDNRLLSLEGLEELPVLSTLVCRRNRLQGVLDFPAPAGLVGSCLRHADLRGNQIAGAISLPRGGGDVDAPERVVGVEAHVRLETLLVDDNQLRSLRGLAAVPHLTALSASSNQLVDTAGATSLRKLAALNLENNLLERCDEIGAMPSLRRLELRGNALSQLPDLSGLRDLRILDVRDNHLGSLDAFAVSVGGAASSCLAIAPIMRLDIKGNPMCERRPDLRKQLLWRLPKIATLDGDKASPEEKVAAHNMHGGDSAELASTRAAFFPDRLNSAALQELPSLLRLYRHQYTKGFAEGQAIPPEFP